MINVLQYSDYVRRCQGHSLGALGWGPIETPSRVVFSEPGLSLKSYHAGKGPAALIIPAPIKRSYIWDLTPASSVVQKLVRNDMCVYLIDWTRPGRQERRFGLAEYADRLILDCLQAVEKEVGPRRVYLIGHSLGGTLAAIFSSLYPERLAGLILLGAPLHFGPNVDPLSHVVAQSPPAPLMAALMGNVPGSFLDVSSLSAAPDAFLYSRWRDWLASLPNREALARHLRVERWTLDESPLAQKFFEEVVEWLYRENRFARGNLHVNKRLARPDQIRSDLLCVAEQVSAVAPPASVGPVYEMAGCLHKQWLWYSGDVGVNLQHVGMLVGQTAHNILWPKIIRWIKLRQKGDT